MDLKKYQEAAIFKVIAHDIRERKPDQSFSNPNIRPELSRNNTTLLSRGSTAKEINAYRKTLEKDVFAYNRKNLVHAIEVVIQCPADCPKDQEEAFFRECYNFWCKRLPMGERCIFLAEIHKDEIVKNRFGERISRDHLHLMFSPCVEDTKHPGYQYKLCADALTRKSILKKLHQELQEHTRQAGLTGTVVGTGSGRGQTIKLSIEQLKELTRITGVALDKPLTFHDLTDLISRNKEQSKQLEDLFKDLREKDNRINEILKDHFEVTAKYSDLMKVSQEQTDKIKTLQKELDDHKKEIQKLKEPKIQDPWGTGSVWGSENPWHTNCDHNDHER